MNQSSLGFDGHLPVSQSDEFQQRQSQLDLLLLQCFFSCAQNTDLQWSVDPFPVSSTKELNFRRKQCEDETSIRQIPAASAAQTTAGAPRGRRQIYIILFFHGWR